MTKAERALELFGSNFNCSQAVLTAFAPDFGLDEHLTLKLGTSLGSGARSGEVCGAISGALMVLGLKYGQYLSEDHEGKARAYAVTDEFIRRFKAVRGSIVCRDLLDYDLSKPEDMVQIREQNLFRTLCPRIIADAVKVLEGVLADFE